MRHFDLCVIGSGSGNSIIDESFDDLSVALVDKGERFGGTCLNVGCIPTKMFVHPADLASSVEHAKRVGVDLGAASADWPAIRDRVFGRIDPISEGGEEWRRSNRNVTLYREAAHFVGPKRLRIGDETITADRFVLAGGSRPYVPDYPGLDDPQVAARVHTSDDIMRLDELPASLVIIGGGFVAAEFAHVFSAFGTKVTVLQRSEVMLRKEDADIAAAFTEQLASRVHLRLKQQIVGFEMTDRDTVIVESVDAKGIHYDFECERVLVALGRIPNGDLLNLAATGVETHPDGRVKVDEYQQTTVKGIFALGDMSSAAQLKHVANHEARVVQHNLLHPRRMIAADHRFIPHAVFSDPQVASVGLTEAEAKERGKPYVTARQNYGDVAYGWAMEDTDHFVKLIADPKTKRLLGAHLLGPEATTLIQPLIQAMSFDLDVPSMARGQYWIHPALTEVVENALLGLKL
ncbi:mycothione reductase [Micropruina sp.]|uniref:mycothione reductase n=1 Tax=Micropruina sp. TaxID=2737536 RepID=UPI00262F69F3|nr:mycothione reductase [Micropruina sp.]